MSSDFLELIEIESNDTIATALPVPLSVDNPLAIATGTINFDFDNNRDVDASEDVDFYAFDLAVGDTIKLDLDEADGPKPLIIGELILFDSEGNNLVRGLPTAPAPDDAFTSIQPFIEFTATEAGTYYAGVSAFFNQFYDPFTAGSGNGFDLQEFGNNGFGNYELVFELVNSETPVTPPPATTPDIPPSDAPPQVSIQTFAGVYGIDGSLVVPAAVETVNDIGLDPILALGGSTISLLLTTEGDIPNTGVEVVLSTGINLAEYAFTFEQFFRGAEILGPVLDSAGNPSGIRLNITDNNALINLTLFDKPELETDGPEEITFTIEDNPGITVNPETAASTVTVYDNVAAYNDAIAVPTPSTEPVVGLTVEDSALVEADGNAARLIFTLSEPPPPEGLTVAVLTATPSAASVNQVFQGLGQFDVLNAEVSGGVFPTPDFTGAGFYFNIREQTAQISVAAFPDAEIEGIQEFQVFLQESAGYQIDPGASSAVITTADTVDSLPQLSLSVTPSVLIESEGTVSVHTFGLSTTPPEGGIVVSVTADGLDEFDIAGLTTTGITGEISVAESNPPQLIFTMTDATATISLPVSDDGESEGVETATFTLNPSDEYQVAPLAGVGSAQIVDTPEQVPPSPVEVEFNDTLDSAIAIPSPTSDEPIVISGEAFYRLDFSNPATWKDISEDVDLYSFDLAAGDAISVDIDAIAPDGSESLLQPVLRIFDASGSELDSVGQVDTLDAITPGAGAAALTFTAQSDGTYYAGISVLGNDDYDPTISGSGSGWTIAGVTEPGAYEVTFSVPSSGNADGVDFDSDGLSAGDVVTDQIDGVTISVAEDLDAMIFDSANPTGGDKDLASDELGNILIISEDGDSTDPDDNIRGGTLMFDWDGVVSLDSIGLLDIEESGGFVTLYGADDSTVLTTVDIPGLANNSLQSLSLSTADVGRMDVFLMGSGAIADIVVNTADSLA
ncbi:MAG: PPC domain-containing protein [Cyanobacteria bacterium P01_F01_bin.150]